jgi:hypothetical protein
MHTLVILDQHTNLLPAEAVLHGEDIFKSSLPVSAVVQNNYSFV